MIKDINTPEATLHICAFQYHAQTCEECIGKKGNFCIYPKGTQWVWLLLLKKSDVKILKDRNVRKSLSKVDKPCLFAIFKKCEENKKNTA